MASAQRQIANLPGWKGKKATEIIPEGPPFPDDIYYVWGWFQEHSLGLTQNGMGPAVVTWESLKAWEGVGGPKLEYWESLTMVRLGVVRANISAEKQNKKK